MYGLKFKYKIINYNKSDYHILQTNVIYGHIIIEYNNEIIFLSYGKKLSWFFKFDIPQLKRIVDYIKTNNE